MKKIILIICCLLLIGGGVWIYNEYYKELPELTLKEAATKGFAAAKKWNPKASLYRAVSIEVEEDRASKGKHGNRLKWSFKFCVPKTKQCKYIRVKGDEVQVETPSFSVLMSDPGVSLKQIQVDSPALLKKAVKQFDLKPSTEGHGRGYHFKILKTSITDKYVYVVTGVQKDGEDTNTQAIYFYLNGKHYGNQFDNKDKGK